MKFRRITLYYLTLLTPSLTVAITLVGARQQPFYRRDYRYFEQYDAFYKLHWDQSSWNLDFIACNDEGAELFYPKYPEEWQVVQNLAQSSTHENVTYIVVGIHNPFEMDEFIAVDGQPTPLPIPDSGDDNVKGNKCVFMRTDDGSFLIDTCETLDPTIPFVCKKEVPQNPCRNIDPNYKYIEETKKCYKFNTNIKPWDKAMQTCFMEGGSLLMVKNSEEASILNKYNNEFSPKEKMYYVGFRKLHENNNYYSVKGHLLADFYNTEQFNQDSSGDCGIIKFMYNRNSEFKTAPCITSLPFICEIDASL